MSDHSDSRINFVARHFEKAMLTGRTFFLLCCLSSVALSNESVAPDVAQDRAAVIATMQAWEQAIETSNYENLENFYTEDAIYYPNNTSPVVGRKNIIDRNRQRGSDAIVDITQQVDDVEVHDSWAVYSCLARVKVLNPNDNAETVRFVRVLLLMQKDIDGNWRIFRDIDNDTPARF